MAVAAPRQLGGNAFDKAVHLAATVFSMSQHRDKLGGCVLAKLGFYAAPVKSSVYAHFPVILLRVFIG